MVLVGRKVLRNEAEWRRRVWVDSQAIVRDTMVKFGSESSRARLAMGFKSTEAVMMVSGFKNRAGATV